MKSSSRGRTGPMAAGLIMAVLALFMAPMSVREICTHLNRSDFVQDELELESFDEGNGGDSARLEGRILPTGERYVTDRMDVVGLDRLRELSREGKVRGYRAPVWYLQKHGLWSTIDRINSFRVRSPDEFAQGLPVGLMAANVAIAGACVLLIRRGAGFPRATRS